MIWLLVVAGCHLPAENVSRVLGAKLPVPRLLGSSWNTALDRRHTAFSRKAPEMSSLPSTTTQVEIACPGLARPGSTCAAAPGGLN